MLSQLQVEQLHIPYKSPEWYSLRTQGIGGSDAAAALGINPWKSNFELWLEKTGQVERENVSNERMEYGTKAEEPITQLFALEHPQFIFIDYKEIVFKRGFQIASVDGGLIERATGKKGGLEIKTTEPISRKSWEEWDGKIPQHYYSQVIHYLSTTGWDFWILKVRFKHYDANGSLLITEREYRFDREDENVAMDIEILEEEEEIFWKNVEEKTRPAHKLPLI